MRRRTESEDAIALIFQPESEYHRRCDLNQAVESIPVPIDAYSSRHTVRPVEEDHVTVGQHLVLAAQFECGPISENTTEIGD